MSQIRIKLEVFNFHDMIMIAGGYQSITYFCEQTLIHTVWGINKIVKETK
jgi:hypothetical protein